MPPKGVKRDKNLDCPNVRAFRDIIRFQLNYLQRQYVVEKVSCCEDGQRLWRATLEETMLHGMNPKNVPAIVKRWEAAYFGVEQRGFEQWKENGEKSDDAYN